MPHPVSLAGGKNTSSDHAFLQRDEDGLGDIFRSRFCQNFILYLEITHAQRSYREIIKEKKKKQKKKEDSCVQME